MGIKANWTDWTIVGDRIQRRFSYEGYNEDGSKDTLEIEIIPGLKTQNEKKAFTFFKKKKSILEKMRADQAACPSVFISLTPGEGYPVSELSCVLYDADKTPLSNPFALRVMQADFVWAVGFEQALQARRFVSLLSSDLEMALQIRQGNAPIITLPLPFEEGLKLAMSRFN